MKFKFDPRKSSTTPLNMLKTVLQWCSNARVGSVYTVFTRVMAIAIVLMAVTSFMRMVEIAVLDFMVSIYFYVTFKHSQTVNLHNICIKGPVAWNLRLKANKKKSNANWFLTNQNRAKDLRLICLICVQTQILVNGVKQRTRLVLRSFFLYIYIHCFIPE